MKEEVINSKVIYDGKILKLRVDDVIANGIKTIREVVEHGGAVAIVPITNDGKIVMVKQYRIAPGHEMLEIPAGKKEKDEEPIEAALRELKEETGYTAREMTHLCDFYTSPGFSNELIRLYLAKDLIAGTMNPDDTESLEVYEYTFSQMQEMILSGEIDDGKTITGVLLAKLF